MDRREELRLVADRAVGQEDHLPETAGMLLAVERLPKRRQHLGAAVRVKTTDVPVGRREILRCRGLCAWKDGVRGVVEADHVEGVAGSQALQRQLQRGLRLIDGDPVHRPGVVDHEDHLARQAKPLERGRSRRRHHEDGERLGVLPLGEERRDRRRFGGEFPHQLEVAVRGHGALRELDPVASVHQRRRLDRVVRGGEARQRSAGIQLDREADWIQRAARRVGGRGRDPRGVRHIDGVG